MRMEEKLDASCEHEMSSAAMPFLTFSRLSESARHKAVRHRVVLAADAYGKGDETMCMEKAPGASFKGRLLLVQESIRE
jgi:hypothetical protein